MRRAAEEGLAALVLGALDIPRVRVVAERLADEQKRLRKP